MVATVAEEADIVKFVAWGELTPVDMFTAYAHFLDTAASRLTLWDLSRATVGHIDAETIRDVARKIAQASRDRRRPGKAAVVCAHPVVVGTVNIAMACLSREEYAAEIAVFTSEEAAKAWLTAGAA
jgi:hypothetical protein